MKQINVYFEDDEYKTLSKTKKELNLSWHDLIILLSKKEITQNDNNKG